MCIIGDDNYTVVNEQQNGSPNHQFTYVGRTLAHRDLNVGTQSVTWTYYYGDQIGSTRRLRDSAKSSVAQFEFDPYGLFYAQSGTTSATTHLYAGLDYDSVGAFHFAPYRTYKGHWGRWFSQDPLGMVDAPNMYAYVEENPVINIDRLGLFTTKQCRQACQQWGEATHQKASTIQACKFVCSELHGNTCQGLFNKCTHDKGHRSKCVNKHFVELCLEFYLWFCNGK